MNSPPTIEELLETIRRIRRRRSMILHVRHISWSLVILTAVFIFFVILEMSLDLPSAASMLLFFLLGGMIGLLCWRYVLAIQRFRSDDLRLAHYIDERLPSLEQRLITSMELWEKQGTDSPSRMVETLWHDTLAHVNNRKVQQVISSRSAFFAVGIAVSLACLLAVALGDSTRFSGAALKVAWPWSVPGADVVQSENFRVVPGDVLIRRGNDVAITAMIENGSSKQVDLYLREAASEWKRVPMRIDELSAEHLYFLPEVTTDISYYVGSSNARSRQYSIQVYDLTRVETIDIDYIYPAYTEIENKTEKDSGDIIAPAGTTVRLRISFTSAVQHSALKFDDGTSVDLNLIDDIASGEFTVAKDGTYIVDAFDQAGRPIENSMEYLIRSTPDLPPEISIEVPGRDLKVMALEEVGITVSARDDFGITELALNYSVGGRLEQSVNFLNVEENAAPRDVDRKTLLYLEDLQVSPGDFIAYFLRAEDNKEFGGPAEVLSDIYFLEVISTDEEFRRGSQQSGGGGQFGQQQPSALLENQKNIIAATWKLLNRKKKNPEQSISEEIRIVADSQQNIAQRTQMSLNRLNERFSFADESYDLAVTHLAEAVEYMQAAAETLYSEQLKDALAPEQAALQAILKANAQSRRTAIQMGSQSGSGGTGSAPFNERDDLRELFEMEMGRLENRYEMPSTASAGGRTEQDEALKRLRQLAQRQEHLNRAQSDANRRQERLTEAQQRRQLEELRREQEAVRREAEALARKWSQQPGIRRTQSSLSSLEQAVRQMREAARNLEQRDPGVAAASGRQALQNLRDQQKRIERSQGTSGGDLVRELSEKGRQLQEQEAEILAQMEALQPSLARDQQGLKRMISEKEYLQEMLKETEDILRAANTAGRKSQPELEQKTLEALRTLKQEDIERRIEASKTGLLAGQLEDALALERRIEQSIQRLSERLHEFDLLVPKTGVEQNQQAATDASALSRELENLQQQAETLRLGRKNSTQSGNEPGNYGSDQTAEMNTLRDGLARSRKYAEGLLEPWAQGESWAVNARSIYRQLSRSQIEDFINQPALWQTLVDPARELASALQEQLEMEQLNSNAFSPSEQAPPSPYESQVETYYRSLSEITP